VEKIKKRIEWIDVMKGIGILTVVAGHIYTGYAHQIIFLFHMPLFFILSGYLFKPTPILKEYFKKKFIHLIIPYIAFLIPIYFLFNGFDFVEGSRKEVIQFFAKPILGGRLLVEETGVFWFVTVLFITQQIMNVLLVKLKKQIVTIIVCIALLICYINSIIFPKIWFPLNANVVFAALPMFYAGYLLKKYKLNSLLILLLGIISVSLVFVFPEHEINMKYSIYGIPVLSFLAGIILTLNIKIISVKLTSIRTVTKIFSELGNASMVIMFLHQPFQYLIKDTITGNTEIRFFTATILSLIFYYIFSKISWTRLLFLGSKKDFDLLKQTILRKRT
jgi:fucose 4-O-acetylase-like acetyltransferase